MTLRVVRHADAGAFLARAGGWLERSEAENNVLLGIAAALASGEHAYDEPVYLATVEEAGSLVGCAWRTPPHKVGLTRMPPAAARTLAADVADVYDRVPAVLGEQGGARAFAEAWASLRDVEARPGMRQRIHRLVAVEPPSRRPPGAPRVAGEVDHELVAGWWRAFHDEAGLPRGRSPAETVARRTRAGDLWLWDDGGAVALAGTAARTARGARIGPVYTPPSSRRRGYATALVAHLSQRMLDEGREHCFLYTDLANPTSNAIYARVGYEPVCDVLDYEFTVPGDREAEARTGGGERGA